MIRFRARGAHLLLVPQGRAQGKAPTANALLSQDGPKTSPLKGIQVKCAYCKGGHFSASCEIVTDPRGRFEILKRDGRCFVCLSLDH